MNRAGRLRDESPRHPARPGLWLGLMMGCIGIVAGLRLSGVIGAPVGFILLALSFTLLIPATRAMNRSRNCTTSTAGRRYNTGIMVAALAYVAGLGIAVRIHDQMTLSPSVMFFVALLPTIPTLAVIYVMGRYVVEEQDEYLRHRAIQASLIGLGAVLAVGSFWGFLETFELVPHVPGWWTVPVYAMGMGLAQCWMSLRNRADGES